MFRQKNAWRICGTLITGMAVVCIYTGCSSGPGAKAGKNFQVAALERGTLQRVVSSTGTLTTDTVEVGAEISGTISEILCDVNQQVKKGQVLARLKTDLLEEAVHEARAALDKAKSQSEEAQIELKQNQDLYDKGYISQTVYLPFKTAAEVDAANLVSAKADLDKAVTNEGYATIRAPIDAMVLDRKVEAGQTIASSFTTPTLFLLAHNLKKMQIAALVDETDIGQIQNGQKVTFTVSAYPDSVFQGVVVQIRHTAITVSNVVNYSVIIDAENPAGILFPGMTATVDFIIERATDAFIVGNEAFTVRPTAAMLRRKASAVPPTGPDDALPPSSGSGPDAGHNARIWYLDASGRVHPLPVQKGITDGTRTAVSGNPELREGLPIIIGVSLVGGMGAPPANPKGPGMMSPMF